jgi:hypothetical protein
VEKPRLAGLFEPPAAREPGAEIAALGDHQAVEATGPDVPQTDRVALGMVEQHCAVSLGGVEIAGPKAIGHAPDPGRCKGQGLPDGVPFLDIVLDHAQRLLGKSLQPQDASLK